ncbi:hypothetical protein [Kordiimonas laminariae]|uniref:endonuclease/exonuclease/phosphatase family protein n=1 Tax=Kordiimonas laminariae TaxID=2917717 RepID=UPI001FF57AE1|nr:hypothetical protein [Kordiimonas laminariae]MCK0069127.1 hypothetical protein [Kordiimonas laminariae]
MPAPVINEFVANHDSTDTNEYIEIFGDPNTDLSNYWIIDIDGDSNAPGRINNVYQVGTTDENGFWVTDFQNNAIQNGTGTLLLVTNFTGSDGSDLDADDDGVLDVTPWDAIIDSIAVSDGGSGDQTYSSVVLTRGFDGDSNTVGGASRVTDGVDTDVVADWVRNDFDGQGIIDGAQAEDGEAINTPGTANLVFEATATFTINEFHADAADTANQFIELYDGGIGSSALDGLVLVLFDGDTDQSYRTIDLTGQTTDADGYFVIGDTGIAGAGLTIASLGLQTGADAIGLFIASAADFPDGTAVTDTNLVDAVVYGSSDADDTGLLTGLNQTTQFDDSASDSDGSSSLGRLTDENFEETSVTAGAENAEPVPEPVFVINEIDTTTDAGADTSEFIEIYDGGVGNASLDGLILVLFDGDTNNSYLTIDLTGQTTDADGYFVIGSSAVAGVDQVIADNLIQNGPDGVALYQDTAANFPDGTAATTVNLIDAVVYNTGGDASALLTALGETTALDENGFEDADRHSIGRTSDGGETEGVLIATPGAENEAAPAPLTPVASNIVINEVDAQTPESDTAEFVELYDGGAGNTPLDGLVLVFFNGSDDASYNAISLDGHSTDENGFFVIGNAATPNVDLVFGNSGLQNGADAVALYQGTEADFPNDTPITTTNLIDVIVYDDGDADDAGLLTGFGETTQFSEAENGDADNQSVGRITDGGDTITALAATPGISNEPVPDFEFNEIRISSSGSSDDTSNFIELHGTPGASLDGLTLLAISSEFAPGTIDFVFDLTGGVADADGIFLLGNSGSGYSFDVGDIQESVDFFSSPVTFILVQDFTGTAADDLDTNDDGTLDVTPFGNVIASITLSNTDATPDQAYSDTVVTSPDGFAPAHVFRATDGEGEFTQGDFSDLSDDTPGITNAVGSSGNPVEAAIYDIQGESHLSSFEGQVVITTGIVTAIDTDSSTPGFYLQDPDGDGNANTSDGIFVATDGNPTVAVGDAVQVIGEVEEAGFSGRLTVTRIDASDVTVESSGNELPDAVVIGINGLRPPTETIISEDEIGSGIDLSDPTDVAANNFDPENDGIDFFEALEGMRVTIEDAVAVSNGANFGEIYTLANRGGGSTGITNRHTISTTEGDLNPERIQIDFDNSIGVDFDTTSVNAGDLLGDVTGVVTYNFGNYEVIPLEFEGVTDGNLEPEVTRLVGDSNSVSVASYNVLNLDPDDVDQIAAQAQQIVTNLRSPDVIALQEVQDNNGSASGTVASDQTLQALIDAIEAAGGPTYSFAVIDPVAENTQGGQPNGNIRVAYLYNDDRVDLVEGSLKALDETLLTDAGVDAADAFNGSRLPLEAQFSFNGEIFTVINNHFTSKGGSDDLFGSNQPAEEAGVERREGQATALNGYVDTLLAADSDANIIVLGDLNDFDFSNTVDILAGGEGDDRILFNQVDNIPIAEGRYTFNFQGNSQAIDQFLVSENLNGHVRFDIVHVNADFIEQASDHDPLLGLITFPTEAVVVETPDPVVVTGTDGDDEQTGSAVADQFDGGAGNDVINAAAGDDFIIGGDGDDTIIAGEGSDASFAGADDTGDDVVDGGQGSDTLGGGAGDDEVDGGEDDDVVYGGAGNDSVNGGADNDTLFSGEGDDTANGGSGDDILWAGAGNDTLTGGDGEDTFIFGRNAGQDVIADFDLAEDILNLEYAVTDFTSVADVTAAASVVTVDGIDGVRIDLGDENSVFIQGLELSDLTTVNYVF